MLSIVTVGGQHGRCHQIAHLFAHAATAPGLDTPDLMVALRRLLLPLPPLEDSLPAPQAKEVYRGRSFSEGQA